MPSGPVSTSISPSEIRVIVFGVVPSCLAASAWLVTRVTSFWHNPRLQMTKTELQSALAETTQTDKRTAEVCDCVLWLDAENSGPAGYLALRTSSLSLSQTTRRPQVDSASGTHVTATVRFSVLLHSGTSAATAAAADSSFCSSLSRLLHAGDLGDGRRRQNSGNLCVI
jgi:hypothetical protein